MTERPDPSMPAKIAGCASAVLLAVAILFVLIVTFGGFSPDKLGGPTP